MTSSTTTTPSRGFVYVATGTGYVEEAVTSARSLRRHHRDLPICLITDREDVPAGVFDDVLVRQDVARKPIDKLHAWSCPYDRAIFLDSDTQVFGDLSPLFSLLDRFDLAVLHDVNRGWHYQLPGVPESFTEFNTGVIAFRRTPAMAGFFQLWQRLHAGLAAREGFVNDQPAFRQALYESDVRVAPIPSEFHFLGSFPNAVFWKVRLVHTRGDLAAIHRRVDEVLGGRAYIPHVGVVPPFAGRFAWLRVTLRTFGRMLRLVFAPPSDTADANPRQWWLEEKSRKPPS